MMRDYPQSSLFSEFQLLKSESPIPYWGIHHFTFKIQIEADYILLYQPYHHDLLSC